MKTDSILPTTKMHRGDPEIGDLVVAPKCSQPDESGLIIGPVRDDGRIGVMWRDGNGFVDFEHPRILKVINEGR